MNENVLDFDWKLDGIRSGNMRINAFDIKTIILSSEESIATNKDKKILPFCKISLKEF
jgi:hypothetical protein